MGEPVKPTYEELVSMLRALEWNHDFSCPICGASEMSWPKEAGLDRHNIGCRLAALLLELPK